MKNTLINVIVFAAGAAIGSTITYVVTRKKVQDECNKRADAEIEEMKRYLEEKNGAQIRIMRERIDSMHNILEEGDIATDEEAEDEEFSEEVRTNYANLTKKYNSEQKGVPRVNKIRVISPDEVGEEQDYDLEALVYYADDVLAYSIDDRKVEDPENLVGDALNHFGELNEDDLVCVRNEYKETDYEITRDSRKYSELELD